MPYSVGERLTKAFPPPVLGKDMTLSDVVDPSSERYKEAVDLRALVDTDAEAAKVFETARGIENLKRQWGVHAAGVIMSAEPLIDIVPLMKREDDGAIITQFDQPPLEDLGLLKMDFLGLRNLTVIQDAVNSIEHNTGSALAIEELDLDADPTTYELLSRGDTLGVFQLDGAPMRSLLRQLKPTNFEDISAVIALYRPGPMGMNSHTNYALRKNGLQQVEAIHPELAEPLSEILGTTFGLIVYQEQVMAVAQKVAGFTLGQADVLRRAMGKKKKSELDKQFADFEAGMQANGYSKQAVQVLWDTLMPFADYAFNKAHSAGYGVLSYWTAYLKANHPAEYMAALLTSVGDSKDKLGMYLSECRRMGIQVLPPDVNESSGDFTAVPSADGVGVGDIRFGLGAIRNVGFGVVEQIRAAREAKGRFTSFHDYLRKVTIQAANKRTVESLIKAGAFDSLGSTRRALLEVHEEAVEGAVQIKRNEANGQVGFDFDSLWDEPEAAADHVPDRPEWAKRDKLAFEREMLGLYVSDHPLAGLELQLAKHATITIPELISGESRLRRGDRHRRRPPDQRAAPHGSQLRQPVRRRPARGLRRRGDRDVPRQDLPGVLAGPRERRHRRHQGPGERARRRHEPARREHVPSRHRSGARLGTARDLGGGAPGDHRRGERAQRRADPSRRQQRGAAPPGPWRQRPDVRAALSGRRHRRPLRRAQTPLGPELRRVT